MSRRAPRFVVLTSLISSLLFALACGDSDPVRKSVPANLEVAGTYDLTSTIEVPASVLATSQVNDFLKLLRLLRDDPAAAFFDVLDQAGVPLANEVYGALPGPLKDELRATINDYVESQPAGTGGRAEVDAVLALANSALTRFDLRSALTLPTSLALTSGTSPAGAAAQHDVEGLVFSLPGAPDVILPRGVLARLTVVGGQLDATPAASLVGAVSADAALTLGDHFFGLAYGEAIFAALNEVGGQTLRARLGRAFDCAAMGKAVAGRCVAFVCIGHERDITEICERGLDAAVDELHDSLADLAFRNVHLAQGDVELWDQPTASAGRDGLVDRLAAGVWKASLDVGTGPRDCRATFEGARR